MQPNGDFRAENYNNFKKSLLGSTAGLSRQKKESENLKRGQMQST